MLCQGGSPPAPRPWRFIWNSPRIIGAKEEEWFRGVGSCRTEIGEFKDEGLEQRCCCSYDAGVSLGEGVDGCRNAGVGGIG
jgi:hypothetical protein